MTFQPLLRTKQWGTNLVLTCQRFLITVKQAISWQEDSIVPTKLTNLKKGIAYVTGKLLEILNGTDKISNSYRRWRKDSSSPVYELVRAMWHHMESYEGQQAKATQIHIHTKIEKKKINIPTYSSVSQDELIKEDISLFRAWKIYLFKYILFKMT